MPRRQVELNDKLDDELIEAFLGSGHTLANLDRDFQEWHKGRDRYYVWAVMIDSPLWQSKIKDAERILTPYLLPQYQRQPHVTILPAGFIDDKSLGLASITAALETFPPFEISLYGLSSFTGSPCFPVIDQKQFLTQLRRALRRIAVDPDSQVDDDHYVPHLTVGLYDDRYPTKEVASKIATLGRGDAGTVYVDRVALVSYETSTVKGPLATVAQFWLGSDRVDVAESTIFNGA